MLELLRNMRFFFFNDTATTEIYTLSLHDALPIYRSCGRRTRSSPGIAAATSDEVAPQRRCQGRTSGAARNLGRSRSEEYTSELQSRQYLVCRLLLEKKK